ncbi:MAG: hypothetical protein IPL79_00770 [Myxococcales bacterium]|nr:hypothetical protein [Myxococcales bacterium]
MRRYGFLVVAWLASAADAAGAAAAPPSQSQPQLARLYTLEIEAAGVFAIDTDRDGSDELVIVGDEAVVVFASESGRIVRAWPLPPERPTAMPLVAGYYDASSHAFVFRSSQRLAGSRLDLASGTLAWDAEPFYPLCQGRSMALDENDGAFFSDDERWRWRRCGEFAASDGRMTWTAAVSLAGRLTVEAATCAAEACGAPKTWGPFGGSGDAFSVWSRQGQPYVVTAGDAPRGGGDTLSIWAAAITGKKSRPLWRGEFAGGIVGIVAINNSATPASPRLLVATALRGASRLDVWELRW